MSAAETAAERAEGRNDAVLAAELALGVLDAEARAQAETRAASDDAFAAAAAAWARDLHALTETVAPVVPSDDLWSRVARLTAPGPTAVDAANPQVDTLEPASSDVDRAVMPFRAAEDSSKASTSPPPRSLAVWRATAFAGVALAAAALAALAVQPLHQAGLGPLLAARLDTAAGGPTLLSPEPLFVAVLDRDRSVVVVTPLGAGPADPRPHQLWLTPRGGAAAPLGAIASKGVQVLRAPAAALKMARRGAVLSVTVGPLDPMRPQHPGPVIASGLLAP